MQPDESISEPIRITLLVVKVLDELQIPYFIDGSLAFAVHGNIQSTLDADLVVDLRVEHSLNLLVTWYGAQTRSTSTIHFKGAGTCNRC